MFTEHYVHITVLQYYNLIPIYLRIILIIHIYKKEP